MTLSKLQEFQMKLGWNEGKYIDCDVPAFIFHYTSPFGMESILFSNKESIELWASRYDCLNDASEGTVAQEIYTNVCNLMLENEDISKEFYELIIDVKPPRTKLMWHRKGETDILTRPEYVRYICSFSKNNDSLSMWNYYTKESKYEGFNLGFYSDSLKQSIETQLVNYETVVGLYPIIYDQTEQEELIRKFITDIYSIYVPEDDNSVRYIVSNQLLDWSLLFKKEYFKHEEEVRLIVDVGKKVLPSQNSIPQIPTNYRMSSGYTVPYIILKIEKDCLSDVTIGPLTCDETNKELQVEVLRERLCLEQYTALGHYSKIPVRY